jgi:hypothetical protein
VSYFYLKDDAALADYVVGRRTRPRAQPKPPKMNWRDWHSASDAERDRYIAWRALKVLERNVAYRARGTEGAADAAAQ